MTREQIINRQNELHNYLVDIVGNGCKRISPSLLKEMAGLQRQLDIIDGKTYNCEKWITEFTGESYNSLKEARFNLINQIKDLKGVEVGEDETGVVGVTCHTEYKNYYYIIHAHYRYDENLKQIYVAFLHPNGWSWRY